MGIVKEHSNSIVDKVLGDIGIPFLSHLNVSESRWRGSEILKNSCILNIGVIYY